MRSQGRVRFIRVPGKVQFAGVLAVAALLLVWVGTIVTVTVRSLLETQDRIALLDRESKVQSAESRVASYRKNVGQVADDLARRQAFIEQMVKANLGDLPADAKAGETVSDSTGEQGKALGKISMELPEAAPLVRLETRQLAFVESLTRYADRQAAQAETALRKLGLNPAAMAARAGDRSAMGGPLMKLATSADGSVDPRFARLGLSLARMDALRRSLQGVPNTLPASLEFISSGFGYRADPFTSEGAFHPGLDFRGPLGAPIYAAAKGTVSFVGERSGYGNVVEIDHGNGLITRYAHMSGFATTVGHAVQPGEVIGRIGSTGRSTGPHLHFEVRINDAPVNPRPFLESAHVRQEIARDAGVRPRG